MQNVKAIGLILFGFLLAFVGSKVFEPETNLDKQILNVAMSSALSVVGYRNNSGNATVGYHYNFYIQADGAELTTPFLVTGSPEIDVQVEGVNRIAIRFKGKVYQFTNLIWVKDKEKLVPVKINFIAEN